MPNQAGPPPSNDIIHRGNAASGLSMQVWPGMNQSYDPNQSMGNPRNLEAYSGNPTPNANVYRNSHMTAHLGNENNPHVYNDMLDSPISHYYQPNQAPNNIRVASSPGEVIDSGLGHSYALSNKYGDPRSKLSQ